MSFFVRLAEVLENRRFIGDSREERPQSITTPFHYFDGATTLWR
jgi:hypothetical protein